MLDMSSVRASVVFAEAGPNPNDFAAAILAVDLEKRKNQPVRMNA
jgi:hypothetical protein